METRNEQGEPQDVARAPEGSNLEQQGVDGRTVYTSFDDWWNANTTWPVGVKNTALLAWRAALSARAAAPAAPAVVPAPATKTRVGTVEISGGKVRSYTFEQTDYADGSYWLYPAPAVAAPAQAEQPWRCFHCDEVFTDAASAQEHFGRSQISEPACTIDAAKYREMEETVRRHCEEDTDLHRTIYAMESRHQTELRCEEEKGYARGLADAQAEQQGGGGAIVELQHVAVAEDGGKLRWLSGRRPHDCELFAMRDGGLAPTKLYTRSATEQPSARVALSEPVQRWTTGTATTADHGGFVAYGDYLELRRAYDAILAASAAEDRNREQG